MMPGFYSEQRTFSTVQTMVVGNFDGEIWQVDFSGNKGQQIGVDMKTYNELLSVANQYKQILVEKGFLEKERTPEEIAKEQNEIISQLANAVQTLTKEVEALKNAESSNRERAGKAGRKPSEIAESN